MIGDVIKWGALGIIFLLLIDKIDKMKLEIPGLGPSNTGRAQVVRVDHGPIPQFGGTMNVQWTINHKGPEEHLRVGLALVNGSVFGRPVTVAARIEADVLTDNDANWRSYQVGITGSTPSFGIEPIGLYGYVADTAGNEISGLSL